MCIRDRVLSRRTHRAWAPFSTQAWIAPIWSHEPDPGEVEVMSLLQRVERAQHGVGIPDSGTLVPVGPGLPPAGPGAPPAGPAAPPRSALPAGREEMLRQVRARLHDEVIRAFDSLGDVSSAADARSKVAGIVDRVIDVNGFSVTRE